MKISFGNHYSQDLNVYHDGYNLAHDLRKYTKRNRLQLVYEPNIEEKILADEALEKGYTAKKKASKAAKLDNKNYEDNEFLKHFPVPSMDKAVSKQEKAKTPLIEELKEDQDLDELDEEAKYSIVYLKRDALYKKLKRVSVSVENSSTLEVIKGKYMFLI